MSNFVLPDDAVVLGFDPGGGHSFGAAVLSRSEFAVTWTSPRGVEWRVL